MEIVLPPALVSLPPTDCEAWLTQGRILAERAAGRSLSPTRYHHDLETMDSGAVRLPMRPVISIEGIQAQRADHYTPLNPHRCDGEWRAIDPADCRLSPSGLLRLPWSGRWRMEVDYVAGWDLDSKTPTRSAVTLLQAIADLSASLAEFDRDGAAGLPQTYRVEGEYSWGYGRDSKSPSQLRYENALTAVRAIVLNA